MFDSTTTRFLGLLLLSILFWTSVASAQQKKPDDPTPLTPKEVSRLLYAALHAGDAQKFASLLELVDAKARDGLLLYAVSRDTEPPLEIIRLLLDNGANVNQPSRYKTALMHAASGGYIELVRLFLARGAEVNAHTDEGTALMQAVVSGRTETVKLLLEAGAEVKAVHRTGDQALMMAARQRSYRTPSLEPTAEMMELLLAKEADVNARGQWGRTALMHANTAAKVKLLVENGADLEARDEQGETALMKAAARGEVAVVTALLETQAAVNARDNEGATALMHSLSRDYYGYYGEEAKTLPQRRLEVAQVILLAKNVDLNAQNGNDETALMRAVRLENVAMIKSLLAKGADPNRSDRFGDTAFILAYSAENAEIEKLFAPVSLKRLPSNVLNAFLRAAIARKDQAKVKELLERDADPNYEHAIDYSHPTVKRTMLILAASVGHAGIVQMLLDKGANVNAKGLLNGSESGLTYGTALDAAQNPEVVAILKKAGQN